jgi:hypothetical protein
MENFLPLRREIREHWVYKDNDYFKVWIDILLSARFSKEPKTDIYKGTIYIINYSEFLYSRPSYSQRLNIPESKLRNLMDNLVNDNMIEKVISLGRNKATIYKVINYEKYNNVPTEYVGAKGIEVKADQLATNSQPTDNQLTTNSQPLKKIDKKEKKEKQEDIKDVYTDEFIDFYKLYPNPQDKQRSFINWKNCLKKHTVAELIKASENYKEFTKGRDRQYIKSSANFLGKDNFYNDYLMENYKEVTNGTDRQSNGESEQADATIKRPRWAASEAVL